MHFTRKLGRHSVSFAIFAKIVKVSDQKCFDKAIAAKGHASLFYFLEIKGDLWNSVESPEFVNRVTK